MFKNSKTRDKNKRIIYVGKIREHMLGEPPCTLFFLCCARIYAIGPNDIGM